MLKRILGLVGWLGVVLVFAAVFASWGPWPKLTPYANKLAITGLVCTLLYIFSQWREVVEAFSARQARFGTLAAATVLVVLGILVAINYLGTRHNKRWDLTAAQQFSLSDQSKKILQDLKEPVKIRVFARSTDFPRFRDRLDEYQYQSKQVSTEYIDAEQKPAVAQQYGVTQLGTVVFEYKGRTEKATADGEQELTNALIKVVQGRTPKVYFTQGHGEKDTTGSDRGGYSAIAGALKGENFVVDKLVLAQSADVPADADVIVIAGPKTDFLEPEIGLLKKYLARGGKLFVMLDPVIKADQPQPTGLQALLKDWGIEADNDIVLDVSGMGRLIGTDESVPVAASYPPHPITENFNLLTAYPLARSISPVEGGVNGHTAQKLVETSPSSWGETNIKSLTGGEAAKLDEGQDKKGPVSLGAAVSATATNIPAPKTPAKDESAKPAETRVVAFGDSDFSSNGWLGIRGNRDLFLNTVNWLALQENLISIRARDPQDRRITLTENQVNLIRLLTIFVVPGLVLLAGVQTWWRRR
jgi:gliding motility-associatede transport system auxiliary component